MNVALYSKAFQNRYMLSMSALIAKLRKCRSKIYIYAPFKDFLVENGQIYEYDGIYTDYSNLPSDTDFLLSIGGDGTLLSSVSIVRNSGVPIAGVNSGRLGFLSGIASDEVDKLIDLLEDRQYKCSERSLIRLDNPWGTFKTGFDCALNEVTIQKRGAPLMLTHVYCNGEFLNTYWSDGLIISTPTGSTAYSMSVGGPIVMPSANNFILSPISPHNLNVRPLVIPDDSVLTIKTESRAESFILSLDSMSEESDCSREIKISMAPFKIKLIESSTGYFSTLRNKLMWGADKRN